ncbi:hypothetical protein [Diplocloster hominis]|uniref:hypothetical protein n=1 Tax=Diplocloster hominis TaxID=3079010 RepID=UPI0031BB5113
MVRTRAAGMAEAACWERAGDCLRPGRKRTGIRGCGLAPAAAKQKRTGGFRNRGYSPRTLEAFSVQSPLRVGGERRHAS